jgi:hypothetical protein
LKCLTCGTENPDMNQFCGNCGKPLSKPQVLSKSVPAGPVQTAAPPARTGSGAGLVLLVGGLIFFALVIGAAIVIIAVMYEDDPGNSPLGSGPRVTESSWDYGQVAEPPGNPVPITVQPGTPSPAYGGGSTSPTELILGTWDIRSSTLRMQFRADGTATLLDAGTGPLGTGSWEKISDGRYRLWSPSGKEYPVLHLDPIAGTMYLEDYSMVFTWKG